MPARALLLLLAAAAEAAARASPGPLYGGPGNGGLDVSDAEYRKLVVSSPSLPALVEFYAPWCGHCQAFAPKYKQLAAALGSARVRVAAVDCVAFRDLCSEQKVRSYPTVKMYGFKGEEDGARFAQGKPAAMAEYALARLPAAVPGSGTGAAQSAAASAAAGLPLSQSSAAAGLPLSQTHAPSAAVGSLGDAAASLVFTLEYGVFAGDDGAVPEVRRAALLRVLGVLSACFPGAPASRAALKQLELKARALDALGHLNATSWRDQALGAAPPARRWALGQHGAKPRWRTCGGGGSEGEGYTCGLWALFHQLPFSAARAGVKPSVVVAAVRDVVEHFFGCAVCRAHFLKSFDRCEFGRCDVDDAAPGHGGHAAVALWLWRVHNDVNARNARIDGGDAELSQFPPAAACAGCRSAAAAAAAAWDEPRVLEALSAAYDVGVEKTPCRTSRGRKRRRPRRRRSRSPCTRRGRRLRRGRRTRRRPSPTRRRTAAPWPSGRSPWGPRPGSGASGGAWPSTAGRSSS